MNIQLLKKTYFNIVMIYMIAGLPIPAIAEDSVLISDLATIESLAR